MLCCIFTLATGLFIVFHGESLPGLFWDLFFNGLLSYNPTVHKENIVIYFKLQNSCVYYTVKSKIRLFGRLFAHLNSDMCIIYF